MCALFKLVLSYFLWSQSNYLPRTSDSFKRLHKIRSAWDKFSSGFISGHVQRDVDWHSGRIRILRRTYNHSDDNLVFLLWDWLSEEKSKYESCAIVTGTHLIPQSVYSLGPLSTHKRNATLNGVSLVGR